MPALTLEIERQLLAAISWKVSGDEGLLAIVWKVTWLIVKHTVLELFQASLQKGTLPWQWGQMKIIPLEKPYKENYIIAKAQRPTSLLAILGKILGSVVTERVPYAVKTNGLHPTSLFGA